MLSLGWLVFFKALVVTLWAATVEVWQAFRKRRAEMGLPLRQDRTGVYVPRDWAETVERTVRTIGRVIMVIGAICSVTVLSIWAYVKFF
jgi:hypothetical protein